MTKRKTKQDPAPRPMTLWEAPLHTVLLSENNAGEKKPKGARTRDSLLAAAAYHLEKDGFVNLRVGDICARAGVSHGTFYVYFENKTAVSTALLSDFTERGLALLRAQGPHADPWSAIRKTTGALTRLYRLNAGLMRCLWQIRDETPEFGEILRQGNDTWMQTVARSILRQSGLSQEEAGSLALGVSYAMAAMTDQFLVQLYVTRDPQLRSVIPDEDTASDLLSVLWYRAVWGSLPPGVEDTQLAALDAFRPMNVT